MVSGVGMVGHFPTHWCNKHFRRTQNVSDKSFLPYIGVVSSVSTGVFFNTIEPLRFEIHIVLAHALCSDSQVTMSRSQ